LPGVWESSLENQKHCYILPEQKNKSVPKLCADIRAYVETLSLSDSLSRYIEVCLSYSEENTEDKQSKVFLNELCAAFEFAYNTPDAGNLKHLYNLIGKPTAVLNLNPIIQKAKSLTDTRGGDLWFKLRILCMDIFCTATIMNDTESNWIIFYGGQSHSVSICQFLMENNYKQATQYDRIRSFMDDVSKDLPYVKILKHPAKEQYVTLLGENHMYTSQAFASYMINFFSEKCDSTKGHEIAVLIEKHPSNQKDSLQQELTCNMQHMAIHKIRCNPITVKKCNNIQILPVDVRHKELGFLRVEFLSCLSKHAKIQESSRIFQETAKQNFINFLLTAQMLATSEKI
jgi:hypothetical protein